MQEFSKYHPIVNFMYFASVIIFSMFFMHPICLGISLVTSFVYSIMLNGKKAIRFNFIYMLPVLILSALLNPAFNHEGVTILTYFPSGNPLTLESVVYGLSAAVMLVSVICWFSCFNTIMTSDKFVWLFGRILPSISLVISMSLRFVPRFKKQFIVVSNAQKCIGRDVNSGKIADRVKNAITITSSLMTWAFENAIQTADSMKSRGYGLAGRTSFSIFRFDRRDAFALAYVFFLAIYVFLGKIFGQASFRYFPSFLGNAPCLYGVSVFAAYLLLCLTPVFIELREAYRWKRKT